MKKNKKIQTANLSGLSTLLFGILLMITLPSTSQTCNYEIKGPQSMCSTSTSVYTLNYTGTVIWTITPAIPANAFQVIGSTLQVSWNLVTLTVPETLTVYINSSCTITYIVQPCCNTGSLANLADLTTSSTFGTSLMSLLPSGSVVLTTSGPVNIYTITGISFYIQGLFLIPNNTEIRIDNCKPIFMGPGAIIKGGGGHSNIYIDNSTIQGKISANGHGCGVMWYGILPFEDNVIEITNSRIEDAQFAVTLFHKNYIRIIGNTFTRNYISIYTPDIGTSALNFFFSSFISKNVFDGSQPLINYYSGQNPIPSPDHNTYAAIYLVRLSDFETDAARSVDKNIFQNINAGIVLDKCVSRIYNCSFINVKPNGSYNNLIGSGCSIYAENNSSNFHPSTLDVGNPLSTSANYKNTFNDCHIGVQIKNRITNNIIGNQFNYIDVTAIKILSCSYKPINIKNNIFEDALNSIYLKGCQGDGGISIENNSVNRTS